VFGETAALFDPYQNRPGFRGNFRVEESVLVQSVRRAASSGWGVGLICHGDAGVARALTSIEAAETSVPVKHRLEHAYVWSPSLMDRAAASRVVWNTQPVVLSLVASQLKGMLGDRIRWAFPFRSMLDRDVVVSAGSDWVVGPINPMLGIDALVRHRSDTARDAEPLVLEESVSVREALRIYTRGGAIAGGEEEEKGSIEPGKFADFVILDRDPLSDDPDRLRDAKVLATYVGGRPAYLADDSLGELREVVAADGTAT
jgi:predicted amidohydrolase YtcJ